MITMNTLISLITLITLITFNLFDHFLKKWKHLKILILRTYAQILCLLNKDVIIPAKEKSNSKKHLKRIEIFNQEITCHEP